MGFLHAPELIALLLIALVIFGPKRLPEIGQGLGKGIREFKKHTDHDEEKPVATGTVQIPAVEPNDVKMAERTAEPAVPSAVPSDPERRA
ncbi:MAG: twin-arginine translocase TatA/TatE family subunit [Chloroflexota bacterium]